MQQLTIPVEAVEGSFSDRIATYSASVAANQISQLLGHDPRPAMWKQLSPQHRKLYEFVQRKPEKSRRESVAGYIEERLGPDAIVIGAFPAISIAFVEPIAFDRAENARYMGICQIPVGPDAMRVLIDGLGRVTGAMELVAQGRGEILKRFSFPVTIYAPKPGTPPLKDHEVAQLFHDFNFRVRPVKAAHAIALDSSDIYITLTNKLAEADVIQRFGGVALRVASLGKKSTELVTQGNLLRFVRGATEGPKAQTANVSHIDDPNLTRATFSTALESCPSSGILGQLASRDKGGSGASGCSC